MALEEVIEVADGELSVSFRGITHEVEGEYKSKGGVTRIFGEVEIEPVEISTVTLLTKVMVTVEYSGKTVVIATYPNKKDSEFIIEITGFVVVAVDSGKGVASQTDNHLRSLIWSQYNSWVYIKNEETGVFPEPIISLNDKEIEVD